MMSNEICFREWLEVNEAWYHPVVAGLALGGNPGEKPVNPQQVVVAPKVEKMTEIDHLYKDLKDQVSHFVGGAGQSEFNRFSNFLLSQAADEFFTSMDGNNPRSIIHSKEDLAERLGEVEIELRRLYNNMVKIEKDARDPQDEKDFSREEKQTKKAFRSRNVGAFAASLDLLRRSVHDFMEKSANYNPQNESEKAAYKDMIADMILLVDSLYMRDGFMERMDLAIKDLEREPGTKPDAYFYNR
jgi:hypothetical protein